MVVKLKKGALPGRYFGLGEEGSTFCTLNLRMAKPVLRAAVNVSRSIATSESVRTKIWTVSRKF
jgi:hypothetical protein